MSIILTNKKCKFSVRRDIKRFSALCFQGAVQELGVYFVAFDRPGYGESDPDPKRSFQSTALDHSYLLRIAHHCDRGS